MKVAELRNLNIDELSSELTSAIIEYKKVKFNLKGGNISSENINKHRILRKKIARIKTIIKELEILQKLNVKYGTEE